MPDTKILSDEEFQSAIDNCFLENEEAEAKLLAHNAALVSQVRMLESQREDALAALGDHPESTVDLAEQISYIRDEGRGHFHTVTKMGEKLHALESELAFSRLAVEILNDIDLRWEKESVSYNLYPKDEKQHAEFEARVKAYLAARVAGEVSMNEPKIVVTGKLEGVKFSGPLTIEFQTDVIEINDVHFLPGVTIRVRKGSNWTGRNCLMIRCQCEVMEREKGD